MMKNDTPRFIYFVDSITHKGEFFEMNETPTIGMGATYGAGTDCYPATVVDILSPKKIQVTGDKHWRIDNRGPYTEDQEYRYETDWDASRVTLSLRKSGRWVPVGLPDSPNHAYYIGSRRAYHDPHF